MQHLMSEYFNTSAASETSGEREVPDCLRTGCPIKNASTLKGRHFFRFEYFLKRFEGGKSLG